MSTDLNIQLSPEAFTALQQLSLVTGRTPSEEAAAAIERQLATAPLRPKLSEQEAQAARERFERHFGSIDLGRPIGIDNEQIDADLAKEYGRGLES